MEDNTLFVNQKHVPNLGASYKRYVNHDGVLKEFKLGFLSNRIVNKKEIYFKLKDLPKYLQKSLKDKSLTKEEIKEITIQIIRKQELRRQEFLDKEDVRIFLNENTEILPIVGNLLPSDGVYAFTITIKNDLITLKPILICGNCHWSDLFAGNTIFGKNVFCLATDLSKEQREYFKEEIIELKDALDFLENKNLVRKI